MHPTTPSERTVPVRMVLWYQRLFAGRLSPCRFSPSCSNYALEALQAHGTRRGLVLTLRRLVRCRPFGPSGWDPVPETRHQHDSTSETTVAESCPPEKGC